MLTRKRIPRIINFPNSYNLGGFLTKNADIISTVATSFGNGLSNIALLQELQLQYDRKLKLQLDKLDAQSKANNTNTLQELSRTNLDLYLTPEVLQLSERMSAYGGPLSNKNMIGGLIAGGIALDKGLGAVVGGNNHTGVGDALSQIPGLGLVGGLINGAFGSNINKEFVLKKNSEIGDTLNSISTATNSSSFLTDFSNKSGVAGFTLDDVGTDGWFSSAASDKYKKMQLASNISNQALTNNFNNQGNNINNALALNQLGRLSAFGGPLFAFGGNVFGNGSNFGTGMIHVNNGDTHEANPYEGVPMGADEEGTPNLVELNETVYNDYVYSNRLTVPVLKFNSKDKLTQEQKILRKYKGMTYADAAKKAEKLCGVNERPNDFIAKLGFEFELQVLANSQEKEREIQEHKDSEQELRNMSDEEFVARKQQQEEAQAQQEALMLQQALLAQLQLLSPEEVQAMLQLLMLQLAVQQLQPQMAYGGVFANGGQMSPEELQAAQALELVQQQELLQLVQQQALSDLVNLLNLTTELPLTEEAPKQELTGIDNGTSANEMSTSELNETIDLIYQYAKANGIKELAKRARKAKRASRESKEDFVDDALEDIDEYELLKSIQQKEQELLDKLNQLDTSQELIALELAQQAAQELNSEEQASAELNAQMLKSLQYANGGLMSDDLIKAMQLIASYYSLYLQKTNPKAYEILNTEFALYAQLNQVSELDLPMLLIQYLASRALLDLQFMQMLKLLNTQYAFGGSMNLNNIDGGNTTDNNNKVFAGSPIKATKTYSEVNAKTYRDFLKYLNANGLSLDGFKSYYKLSNNGKEWTRKNYSIKDANDWIKSINKSNLEDVARQYLDNLSYDLLTALANALNINVNKIANDTNRVLSYKLAILDNTSNYNRYREILLPKALPYRDKDFTPTWTDSPTLKIKGAEKYLSNFFTGDNAQSNLDEYYEKRLADFLKSNNIPGYTTNGKVKDNFYLTGEQARAFNNYLENTTGDDADKSKELAKMFRMSHSSNANWDNDASWNYKNKYFEDGTILENEDYRNYYSNPKNGGKETNALKLDSLWERKHSPKLDFLYEETPVKERTAYYVDGKEIDPTNYLDKNGTWNNPSWKAIVASDLSSDDGSTITHRYNLTETALPSVEETPNKDTSKLDKYPIPSTWPLYGAAGLQAGLAIANAVTPLDTTYGDALISAARTAGLYNSVSATPLGNYVKYTPYDINYINNLANANNLAAIRQLQNSSNGNTGALMAGLLALNYNYGLGIGNNYRQAMEYNDKNRLETATFNRATDLYNSESNLKALMANQDALLKASQIKLEGLAKGYAMNQAAKDAKEKAINAGFSGAIDLAFKAYQLSVANKQAAWRLNHNYRFDANGNPLEYDTTTGTWKRVASTGGKLRTKRNRGISF